MTSNKIQWEGKIPDSDASWISFSDQTKNGYEYDDGRKSITASTSSNNGKISDDITFDLKENNTASPRNTTVVFTQQGTGLKAYYNVQQKVGHIAFPYTGQTESAISYVESVQVLPDGQPIKYSATTYSFSSSYKLITIYKKLFYYADDPNKIPFVSGDTYQKTTLTSNNPNDFDWIPLDNCNSVNNGIAKFNQNDDKNGTRIIKVKAKFKNAKDSTIDDTGNVVQGKNEDVIKYYITVSTPDLKWKHNETGSKTFTVDSYKTINGKRAEGIVPFTVDEDTNNNLFDWQTNGNTVTVYPIDKNTSRDEDNTDRIEITSNENNAVKEFVNLIQYRDSDVIDSVFKVDTTSLTWTWDDTTTKTITVDSYKTRNGANDGSIDFTIKDSSTSLFTITKNSDNTITCYPNQENKSSSESNDFTLTLVQNNSNKEIDISLSQSTNSTEYYAYKFDVQPREAIWESSQYGENVESAFTITSKYAKYKYGETPSDSNYTNDCQYILDPQPSTMKAFSYELTNQKILTYPKGKNDSLNQNIISAVTITQKNFNNSGNSTESPITIKLIQKPQNATPPFDYMVLKYYWTDDDGKDLDTAIYIQGTNEQNIDEHYVGFDLGYSNKYITHAGDNTKSGYETLYIDMPSIVNTITADTSNNVRKFDVCALGNWYNTKKNGNIKCSVKLYKGGTMSRKSDDSSSIDYYEFVNNGGEDVTPSNGLTLSKKVNASGSYIRNAGKEIYVDEFYTTLFKVNYSIDTKSATISDWNDNEGHIINGNFGRTIQIQSSGYTNEENISPSLNVDGNDMDLQCKSVISYSLTYYSGTTSISNPNWGETVTDVQIKNNKISYTITIPENKENFKKEFDINFSISMAYSNGKEFNGYMKIEYYQEPSS